MCVAGDVANLTMPRAVFALLVALSAVRAPIGMIIQTEVTSDGEQLTSESEAIEVGDETDGDAVFEVDLNVEEEDQIEGVVDQLASQFASQMKRHLTSQIKAHRGGVSSSKLAQSKMVRMSELHLAAANNQFEVCEKLLANGADPNLWSQMQMTPLHSAAEGGYKDIVNLLLAHNATIDAAGPHGVTPLHLAAHKGRASTVELLLREGAPIEATMDDSFRFTPLYMASDMGHTRVVEILLVANASTERRSHEGFTPLHAATLNGHEKVVQLLLEHGAYVDARDDQGTRALTYAREMGRQEEAEVLVQFGAAPVLEEEREALRSRGGFKLEAKPFMRLG